MGRGAGPARHELPAVDEAALAAARNADQLLAYARDRGVSRWAEFLGPMPDLLREATLPDLAATARKARSAYGARDSIRDSLPLELTDPFRDSIDRLLKTIARETAEPRD